MTKEEVMARACEIGEAMLRGQLDRMPEYGCDLSGLVKPPTCADCSLPPTHAEATFVINRYVNGHPDPEMTIVRLCCEAHRRVF